MEERMSRRRQGSNASDRYWDSLRKAVAHQVEKRGARSGTKKRKLVILASVGLISLTGATAGAGYIYSRPISYGPRYDGKPEGKGDLGGGHSASSDAVYIGCSYTANVGQALAGDCYVKADGQERKCSSASGSSTSVITNSLSLNGDSNLVFAWDDPTCDNLSAETASENGYRSTGAASSVSVPVSIANNLAKGAIGTVYNAADNIQHIGCSLQATETALTAACSAHDANAASATFNCSSTDSAIVQAVQAIKEDSYLEITRSGSACTKVHVRNDSRYAPRR
jgi:hypothetical protein